MRGNETLVYAGFYTRVSEFPIPMRGNEVADRYRKAEAEQVSDPHEG